MLGIRSGFIRNSGRDRTTCNIEFWSRFLLITRIERTPYNYFTFWAGFGRVLGFRSSLDWCFKASLYLVERIQSLELKPKSAGLTLAPQIRGSFVECYGNTKQTWSTDTMLVKSIVCLDTEIR